ncbi:Hypothetical protein Ccan_19490 [Capnocytophaga canimorsus Cc5]|uniref:Uncharacterized protein n=1 Tax=Capnocytophaga canimorsus (strain 5) TaxID=860228 RepID=F9YTM0_CAPCC|nr:Hypothetical protein Ccan_19490 [Capnocytophaga canimorsus Cc5]
MKLSIILAIFQNVLYTIVFLCFLLYFCTLFFFLENPVFQFIIKSQK